MRRVYCTKLRTLAEVVGIGCWYLGPSVVFEKGPTVTV